VRGAGRVPGITGWAVTQHGLAEDGRDLLECTGFATWQPVTWRQERLPLSGATGRGRWPLRTARMRIAGSFSTGLPGPGPCWG
jgi:hypothetical protein